MTPEEAVTLDGPTKHIYVKGHLIREGKPDAFIIQTSAGPIATNSLLIDGPSLGIYRPNDPLPNGTQLWIETTAPIVIDP